MKCDRTDAVKFVEVGFARAVVTIFFTLAVAIPHNTILTAAQLS
jgi:hypothetical protein